jgi:4-hydroxybenzoate polyprenyltransferase
MAGRFGESLMIVRYHIVLVAMAACVTFGWLLTGRYLVGAALLCGIDWFVINLSNRITDVAEDERNGIPGTARVARSRGALLALCLALLVGSLAWTFVRMPELLGWRLAVQAIGVAYNFRVLPTPAGLRLGAWGAAAAPGFRLSRFKEMYFFKNFGSAALFVLTCFAYPLAAAPRDRVASFATAATLVLFFVPYELTFEILYDLRDVEGDLAEGVPTYPVVHGAKTSRQIIDALLATSAVVLVVGFFVRALGARELLMLAAPLAQLVFYRPRVKRGLTTPDCVWLTHLGTTELVFFLVGTALWLRAGLPEDVWLP